jgi:hypothetical protein
MGCLLLGTLTRKFCRPMIFWMGFYLTGRFGVLAYANDLKFYMRDSTTDDCRLFQQALDHLQGWFREKTYDLNAGKCKSIQWCTGIKRPLRHSIQKNPKSPSFCIWYIPCQKFS